MKFLVQMSKIEGIRFLLHFYYIKWFVFESKRIAKHLEYSWILKKSKNRAYKIIINIKQTWPSCGCKAS